VEVPCRFEAAKACPSLEPGVHSGIVRKNAARAADPSASATLIRSPVVSCPVLSLPRRTCRGTEVFAVRGTAFLFGGWKNEVRAPKQRTGYLMNQRARSPIPPQKQPMPSRTHAMRPKPDHGEESYRGCGKLDGKKTVITGGDSGIGRAVAIAYAREGADVLVAHLNEHDDAKQTQRLVEQAGRKAVLVSGDIASAAHCRAIIDKAVNELGGIDILVNNAAHQATFKSMDEISTQAHSKAEKPHARWGDFEAVI
jgi:hypothetical protein